MADETKRMHMVTDVVHDAGGMTVLYGPGELHEPGTLPEGVAYREVLASDVHLATAPAHAQPDKPRAEPAPEPESKAPASESKTPAAKASGKA